MAPAQYALPWKQTGVASDLGPYIGTSGWNYRSWAKTVLRGVPLKRRLAHLSGMFNAVEINGSFYGQVAHKTYEAWRAATGPGFRFSVKGHRFVTHYKRLLDCAEPVERLRAQALGLGDKLAVVLWQLPAHFQANVGRLDDFLAVLGRVWPDSRHALELRHASWFTSQIRDHLARARVASVLSDAPDFPLWDAVTTDLVYVRLHGHRRKYASSYSRPSLQRWADRILAWLEQKLTVHVYFDNDAEGAAVANALTLRKLLDLHDPPAC